MKNILLLACIFSGTFLFSCNKESLELSKSGTSVNSQSDALVNNSSKAVSMISMRPKPLGPLDTIITK